MKIKKTLFSTEMDISMDEVMDFHYKIPMSARIGIWKWIKKTFNLDLIAITEKKD